MDAPQSSNNRRDGVRVAHWCPRLIGKSQTSRPAFGHSADANVSGDCVGAAALQAKSLLSTALFLFIARRRGGSNVAAGGTELSLGLVGPVCGGGLRQASRTE